MSMLPNKKSVPISTHFPIRSISSLGAFSYQFSISFLAASTEIEKALNNPLNKQEHQTQANAISMSSENFSFSKKPIIHHSTSKRHSVISDIIPNDSNSNYTTTASSRNPGDSTRTFSNNSDLQNNTNLIKSTASPDDPLLDYDEQIRAPKFQTKKSLDDIGSASNQFESNDLMDKSAQKAKNRANKRKNSTRNNHNGEILTDYQESLASSSTSTKNTTSRSTYQPAKLVDMSQVLSTSDSSLPKPTTSTSLGDNLYNIEQYLVNSTSSNIIYNHAPSESTTNNNSTATTTPLSSKKNSNESIHQFSSKKMPRFSMAPLRPLDDPKTPNYIPCVLRPNSYNSSAFDQASLLDHMQQDDTMEQANTLSHDHWKPNNASSNCFDCDRPFSLINRRHHCRKCGEIFCGNCLLSKAKLNFDCKFDINGILAKVCFACGKSWSNFIIENFKQVDRSLYPNFKKRDVITSEADHHQEQHQQQQFADKAGREVSVPADWTWSSF